MTLTDRDKKLVLVLLPVAALIVYWMFVLSPQRAEVSKLDEQLSGVESQRDQAVAKANALDQSKANYARDYATVVRLGKAIPTTVDMPSLLVQLDAAADGTGIDFDSVTAGPRASASGAASGSTTGSPPTDAGGQEAQTGAGQQVEKANESAATADDANKAAGSETAGQAGGGTAQGSGVAGLDSVPLNFTFNGGYFELADFMHRVKRYVRVVNDDVKVRGRLMTIDGINFKATKFPTVTAEITATVYLSPKAEGADAGGTPQGPAAATPATQPGSATPPAAAQPAPASTSESGGSQ